MLYLDKCFTVLYECRDLLSENTLAHYIGQLECTLQTSLKIQTRCQLEALFQLVALDGSLVEGESACKYDENRMNSAMMYLHVSISSEFCPSVSPVA